MKGMNRYLLLNAVTLCFLLILGCASFQPRPMEEVKFKERAQTKVDGGVRVTAAVLSAEESKEVFGVDLYKKGIQPIWLEIENGEKEPVAFLPGSVDREYFTPLQVSHLTYFTHAKDLNQEIDRHFYDLSMGYDIGPNKVRSGFVFTHLDTHTNCRTGNLSVGEIVSVYSIP